MNLRNLLFCLSIFFVASCSETQDNSTSTTKIPVLLEADAVPVKVTDEITAHGAHYVIANYGKDTTVVYRVNLYVGKTQWLDSAVVYIPRGDTISGEIVFGNAPYREGDTTRLIGSLHTVPLR